MATSWNGSRPLRLISTSWSDNENKGGPTYAWLDAVLDRSRFEYTFVGRTRHPLPLGRTLPPQPSDRLAELLRDHDVFVTARVNDPCSNALLEALACGLPAVYRASGGHPELVGDAGVPFESAEDVPDALLQLSSDLDGYRSQITVPSLASVADAYVRVLGLGEASP